MRSPYVVYAVIALVAGIIGGIVSSVLWLIIRGRSSTPRNDGNGPIRVRRLTLVDDGGRERALLRVLGGDVTLLLTDSAMSWRIRLSAGDRGPFLHFLERDVNSRLGIGILHGCPGLELADGDGTSRASLNVDTAGVASLTLRDGKGIVRGSFAMSADGDPSLVLSDRAGNILAKLP